MKLGSVCDVVRGSSPRPKSDPRYYGGSVPRLMVADVTRDGKVVSARIDSLTELGAKQSRLMKRGDVVIAVSGAPGLPAILSHDACIHDGFVGLRSLDAARVDSDFLYSYLVFARATSNGKAVGAIFKNLTTDQIKDIDVPDLPLPDQRRIAEVLDRAEAVRAKRRAALAQLDSLTQSIFLDMFGDPATNLKDWPICTIGDLLESASYGTSEKAGPTGEFPVLRMNNISPSGEMDFADLKFMNLEPNQHERFLARAGDVLFNRTNSADLVGKTGIFREVKPMAYAGYLIRLRLTKENVPEFLWRFLNSGYAKRMLRGMCKSIIGMANINATEIQGMKIPHPPFSLQREFARRVAAVEKLTTAQRASLAELDALFASLQHRAFRGEL